MGEKVIESTLQYTIERFDNLLYLIRGKMYFFAEDANIFSAPILPWIEHKPVKCRKRSQRVE